MNPKEHRKDFNRRWNIPLLLDSSEVAFQKFKQRILNIFNGIDGIVTEESISDFCQYYGIAQKFKKILFDVYNITIIDRLKNENDKQAFYMLIEVILSLKLKTPTPADILFSPPPEYPSQLKYYNNQNNIIERVKKAVEISDINVTVGKSKGRITLYPKGEKILDNELVNKTLLFLDSKSNKHFEEALKFYQGKKHKESAERLRQSVEEFLRQKLQNKKGLSGNITTLQKRLKDIDNQPQVRNIIFQVFNYLDQYFNDHSKHGDNVNEVENEFLIYQMGLLLRYINKLVSKNITTSYP